MEKQLVFISHITEEKELALDLKKLIEDKFLGMVDVFVSSDENSIKLGQEWLDNITLGLRTCCIELILCSQISITRPWINFEAGAGWVRENCTVIPMCHSNIRPEDLPIPLNLLQGMMLNNQIKVQELIKYIACQIGCNLPSLDCNEFISKVKSFEERYTYWDSINNLFETICEILAKEGLVKTENGLINIENAIDNYKTLLLHVSNNPLIIYIPQSKYDADVLGKLYNYNFINIQRSGETCVMSDGMFLGFTIEKMANFDTIVNNPNFKYNLLELQNAK